MEENKEMLQLSNEELEGLDLGDLNLESQFYIPMELENLEGVKYDRKEFDKGIKNVSFVCGQLTALINSGLSSADALNYVLNKETCDYNLKLQREINQNNIDVSKVQEAKVQGQML